MAESQWTIDTLKEFFQAKIDAEVAAREAAVDLLKARLNAADEALKLQAEANKVHFDSLNHEGQRLLAANAASVPRELYDADRKSGEEWRRTTEERLGKTLSEATFNAYKESTQRATNIQTGKSEGLGLTGATIMQLLLAAGVIGSLLFGASTFFSGTRALPVSNPVTYIPGGFPGPAGLVAPPSQATPTPAH